MRDHLPRTPLTCSEPLVPPERPVWSWAEAHAVCKNSTSCWEASGGRRGEGPAHAHRTLADVSLGMCGEAKWEHEGSRFGSPNLLLANWLFGGGRPPVSATQGFNEQRTDWRKGTEEAGASRSRLRRGKEPDDYTQKHSSNTSHSATYSPGWRGAAVVAASSQCRALGCAWTRPPGLRHPAHCAWASCAWPILCGVLVRCCACRCGYPEVPALQARPQGQPIRREGPRKGRGTPGRPEP
jgi:hypothetical protein